MLFLISGFLSVPHSDSLLFMRHYVPLKSVLWLAPLITHVFLYVSSFLQKLFVSWLLHATHSLCASLHSFKSVRTLSRVPRSDRVPTNKKDTRLSVFFIQRLSILPGRFQPSTFDVCELNYRVRHGYGCILTAIATVSESVLSKLYRRIFHLRFLKVF